MSELLAEIRFRLARLLGLVPDVCADVERMRADAEARQRAVLWAESALEMFVWQHRIAVEASKAYARNVQRQHAARLRAQVDQLERMDAEHAEYRLTFHGVAPDTLAEIERCGARRQA